MDGPNKWVINLVVVQNSDSCLKNLFRPRRTKVIEGAISSTNIGSNYSKIIK
jgi:hypothetical protein